MGHRLGDRSGLARVILTGVCLLAVALMCTCSRERPLAPKPVPELLVHEPWEDREAEEFALSMSGMLSAPRALYDSIRADLAQVRATWGDTFPDVRNGFVISPRPGFAWIWPDDRALLEMKAGTYTAWDSLNELLWVSFDVEARWLGIQSSARLNALRMIELYEQLSGMREVDGNHLIRLGGNIPLLSGFEDAAGRHYVFSDATWLSPRFYDYFVADQQGVKYVGRHNVTDPEPRWWWVVEKAIRVFQAGDDQFRFHDKTPPGCVTDLTVVGTQSGDSVHITFTIPGDNFGTKEPAGFGILRSLSPISEDHSPYPSKVSVYGWAGRSGDKIQWAVRSLDLTEMNYVALRMYDAAGNWSRISNVVTCQTD